VNGAATQQLDLLSANVSAGFVRELMPQTPGGARLNASFASGMTSCSLSWLLSTVTSSP
jgi:hypothetical protein